MTKVIVFALKKTISAYIITEQVNVSVILENMDFIVLNGIFYDT